MQPYDQYRELQAGYTLEVEQLQAKYDRASYLRLVVFVAAIALVILGAQISPWLGLVLAMLGIGTFGTLLRWHEGISKRRNQMEVLAKINGRELQALQGQYQWNSSGSSFHDDDHPYSADLDIFVPHGLFQMINRAQTYAGRALLADWLCNKANPKTIGDRQLAIAELKRDTSFRQDLQLAAFDVVDSGIGVDSVRQWLELPDLVINNSSLKLAIRLAPFLVFPAIIAWANYIGINSAWLVLVPTGLILWRTKKRVDEIQKMAGSAFDLMKSYGNLIGTIEESSFDAPLLRELKSIFSSEQKQVSAQLTSLGYAIRQLNVRDNFFALLFNLFGLWDLYWVWRMEKKKAQIKDHFETWIAAVSAFESLASFGTLAHNQPDWPFPEVALDNDLQATDLGHPQIGSEKRVANDISMPLDNHVRLITGSNMAGKSTFLRTVGINMVLGLAGAPVCASSMRMAPAQVYTSMRTADNLSEGASTFYAELARLKMIITAVEGSEPVFFLLDEILKGTNSADRQRGSIALIYQLLDSGGAGLLATHDLGLTTLEAQSPGKIENWYFDVVIEEGKLKFDYTIKKGICESFNASHLMASMGFKLDQNVKN